MNQWRDVHQSPYTHGVRAKSDYIGQIFFLGRTSRVEAVSEVPLSEELAGVYHAKRAKHKELNFLVPYMHPLQIHSRLGKVSTAGSCAW